MNSEEIIEVFHANSKTHGEFFRVRKQLHPRSDIHAFLLLASILPPGENTIIAGADHDKIFLECNVDDLVNRITEDQIIELIRCRVFLEDENYLAMFV